MRGSVPSRHPESGNVVVWMFAAVVVLGVAGLITWRLLRDGRQTSEWGEIRGSVVAEWCKGGRAMKISQSATYIDRRGRKWSVPKGTIVDGASIPRGLWDIAGAPFAGQYRTASTLHDYECYMRRVSSGEVHQMFYEACRAEGLSANRAKLFYWAVYWFGPKWNLGDGPKSQPSCASSPPESVPPAQAKKAFREFNLERSEKVLRRDTLDRMSRLAPSNASDLRRAGEMLRLRTAPTNPVMREANRKAQAEALKQAEEWINRENPNLSELKSLDWLGRKR